MKATLLLLALPYLAYGQILGNPFSFSSPEVRAHAGLSQPQRVWQPNNAKYGYAGTGIVSGIGVYFRSTSVDGGPVIALQYNDHNAEGNLGQPRVHMLRASLGAWSEVQLPYENVVIMQANFDKAWQFKPDRYSGLGGSLMLTYEAVKRYGVGARYSYLYFSSHTLSLLEFFVNVRFL